MSPRLAAWAQARRDFEWQGHRLFVRDEGTGPAVVLLHGYPTGSYDWHAVWPWLQPGLRLIAPDFLGMGFSDKPRSHDYTITSHAASVDALLDALSVREFHLVAHDLGVRVAQELLARREQAHGHAAAIRSLVLLNGAMCPEAYRPRPIQRLLASPLGGWIAPHIPRSAFARTVRELFGPRRPASEALIDDFWSLLQYGQGQRVTHAVGRFWTPRRALRDRLVGALLRSRVPLRVINGARDPNSGRHMVQRLLELSPGTDVVWLEHAGHWPHIEEPEATAAAIREIIEAPGQGAGPAACGAASAGTWHSAQ